MALVPSSSRPIDPNAAVDSWNGRTGAVVPAAGDYTFGQITTAVNAIPVSKIAGVLAGQVIGGVTPAGLYPPGYIIASGSITANANITDTSEATGTSLIATSPASVAYDGTLVRCEFFCAQVFSDTGAAGDTVLVSLFEDTGAPTQITRLWAWRNPSVTSQSGDGAYAVFYFTPSAGAHKYYIAASASVTTGTPRLSAGPGTATNYPPAFLILSKAG